MLGARIELASQPPQVFAGDYPAETRGLSRTLLCASVSSSCVFVSLRVSAAGLRRHLRVPDGRINGDRRVKSLPRLPDEYIV